MTKTHRYKYLISFISIHIYLFLMKWISNKFLFNQFLSKQLLLPHLLFFFYRQFQQIFWLKFKLFFFKKFNLETSNLLKSTVYWILHYLDVALVPSKSTPTYIYNIDTRISKLQSISIFNYQYYRAIPLTLFPIHKTTFNHIMFYIISILPYIYISPRVEFSYYYTFNYLLKPLYIYSFLNIFYFKVHHI